MTAIPALDSLFKNLHDQPRVPAPWTDGKAVAIYGGGSFGRSLCQALLDQNIPVTCLIDRGAQPNQTWRGLKVLHPDSISGSQWGSLTVIVGIHNPGAPVATIVSELTSRGCLRVLSPISALSHLGSSFGNRYWLVAPNYYRPFESLVLAARKLLEPESLLLFDAVMAQRLTGDYSLLPAPTHGIDDYAPKDVFHLPEPVRLVDGGAFDGDTIRALLDRNIPIESIAGFEPDPANFAKLAQWISTHPELEAALWPCGVYSHASQLRFSAGEGEASALSPNGQSTIQCVALDEALPSFRPTFLKLDVEGAEPAALMGARRMIQQHRPFISAGLYHHPAHIWQVPLLVKELCASYRLHLRLHAENGFELRLYAVPAAKGE